MKKVLAMLMALSMVMALASCGSTASSDTAAETEPAVETTTAEVTTDAADGGVDTGFQELPIFEDEEVGFLHVNAVYFQPVPMSNGNEDISAYNLHLEADVSAMENTVGFGVGDWVPYMTVDYKITASDGTVAAEGTFMEMSASDGPHYGANIYLGEADTYSIDFTFHSPEENGYLVHTDAETGPEGTFDDYWGDGNLTVHYEGWDYTPQEW